MVLCSRRILPLCSRRILPPELLYEIYKYFTIQDYLELRKAYKKCPYLQYLVKSFDTVLEAKLIYHQVNIKINRRYRFDRKPPYHIPKICWGLLAGIDLIVKTSPYYFNTKGIFIRACSNGFKDFADMLLQNPSVDPTVDNHFAIQTAAYNGHYEIVKLLLEDGRVDPCACNNYAIKWARRNGHQRVVNLLICYVKRNSSSLPVMVYKDMF